jgi:hypothetical protein
MFRPLFLFPVIEGAQRLKNPGVLEGKRSFSEAFWHGWILF